MFYAFYKRLLLCLVLISRSICAMELKEEQPLFGRFLELPSELQKEVCKAGLYSADNLPQLKKIVKGLCLTNKSVYKNTIEYIKENNMCAVMHYYTQRFPFLDGQKIAYSFSKEENKSHINQSQLFVIAVTNNMFDEAKNILKRHIDVDIQGLFPLEKSKTALVHCCQDLETLSQQDKSNLLRQIELLLVNGANPNRVCSTSRFCCIKSLLLQAAETNNTELIKLLITYSANPYVIEEIGRSVYELIENNEVEGINLQDIQNLISKKYVKPTKKVPSKATFDILMYSYYKKDPKILNEFDFLAQDIRGYTFLHHAIFGLSFYDNKLLLCNLVTFLFEKNILSSVVNLQDNWGRTPLFLLCARIATDSLHLQAPLVNQFLHTLLANGANPYITEYEDGNNCFYIAKSFYTVKDNSMLLKALQESSKQI